MKTKTEIRLGWRFPIIDRGVGIAVASASALVLGGCISLKDAPQCEGADPDMIDHVTLCPGASAYCATSPCAVQWAMPPGATGSYTILVNQVRAGSAKGGAIVSLGAYWSGDYVFVVEGHPQYEPAYLTASDSHN